MNLSILFTIDNILLLERQIILVNKMEVKALSNRINSEDPNDTNTNNNGLAERDITGDDMKEYKNAMDNNRSYVSEGKGWSSSSHQFSREPSQPK